MLTAIDRLSSRRRHVARARGWSPSLSAIAGKPVTIDAEALASDVGQVDIGYFGVGDRRAALRRRGDQPARPGCPSPRWRRWPACGSHTIGVGTPRRARWCRSTASAWPPRSTASCWRRWPRSPTARYHEADDAAALAEISKTIDLRFKLVSEHTEVSGLFAGARSVLLLAGAAAVGAVVRAGGVT